jgi:hypothetical protein
MIDEVGAATFRARRVVDLLDRVRAWFGLPGLRL